MKNKLILINGAPRVGKDTIGKRFINSSIYKMATPIEEIFRALFPMSDELYIRLREFDKDIPQKMFGGKSLRQMFITISEEWIKPTLGKDFFGKCAGEFLKEKYKNNWVITDSGFTCEVSALLKEIGDIFDIIGITVYRPHHSFDGDSREYVNFKNLGVDNHYEIYNTSGLPELYTKVQDLKDVINKAFNAG